MSPFAESVNGVSTVGGKPLVHGKAGGVDMDDEYGVGSDELSVDVVVGSPIHRRIGETYAESSADFISVAAEKMSSLGHVDTALVRGGISAIFVLGTLSQDVTAAELFVGEVSILGRAAVLVATAEKMPR